MLNSIMRLVMHVVHYLLLLFRFKLWRQHPQRSLHCCITANRIRITRTMLVSLASLHAGRNYFAKL